MSNSGNSGGNGNSVHVLVFPFPAQGHMLPLLDLTHQLALHSSLAITILVTPKNKTLLTPLLSKHPSIQTLILPFPNHPSIPLGVENVKDLSAQAFVPMICALGQLYDPLLRWFQSHPSPPAAIISDFFLGWTNHLACHIGIPRIVFSPSGLATLSLSNSMWRDLPKIDDPNDPNFPISFPKVPNSPTFLWWQVSTVYRRYVEGHPDSEFIRDNFLANIASWGIVFNSFFELESVYFTHMRKDLGHHRVWAVGPLLPPGDDPTTERGGSSSVAAGDVISWLDRCRDNSVELHPTTWKDW
uniref:UDP-glycosyltransferase 89B1-like n=1 Tax=Nelumbo nucifera TaxID=4432 RepID=A0A822YR90_NELNU|nr:TPA_asm: hypothetical protein HUJ06_005772 [Nelumbo nucifera]